MASRQRRAILIHNDKAGDKRHEREALVDLLERAGYSVSYFPAKHCDLGEVLGHPAEIIVSAGGDGTVARVVREARSDGPPIAVLPLGTANNIATSLGIGGSIEDLVAGWPEARDRPYYPVSARRSPGSSAASVSTANCGMASPTPGRPIPGRSSASRPSRSLCISSSPAESLRRCRSRAIG